MRKSWKLGLSAIVLAVAVAGCQIKVDGLANVTGPSEVSEKPKPGKGVTPEPPAPTQAPAKPSDTKGLGHLRGRVFGRMGSAQPLPLAEVKADGQRVFAANPMEDQVFEEEASNASKDQLSVMHAFEPGGEPELALRILRKRPPAEGSKYVYLRPGEFFLEGLTAGMVDLEAGFDGKTSTMPVRVMKDTIVEDISLTIDLPEPILVGPDGKVPPIVEWTTLDPVNGISLAVNTRRETDATGQVSVTTTLTYKPDPPDVSITLKAPIGSPGTVISAYELSYEYTTPNLQREGKPPIVMNPILIPIAPLTVPRALEGEPSKPVTIRVPLGSRTLNDLFKGSQSDQPGIIVANIEFKDDKGVPVPNKDLNALKVSVPIRAL